MARAAGARTPRGRLVLATALTVCLLSGCNGQGAASLDRATESGAGPEWFSERAQASGINFTHVNGMSGKLYMAEILAPGVGLLDFDGDGDLDVYLVQGQLLGGAGEARPPDRLYRNDLTVDSRGRVLRFTDVTSQSGIVARGYGMGVASGDFNNDGWIDLYLTKYDAPNQLFRNNGNGTFTDVSAPSGTNHRSWSVSAAFVDVDRDGWLDLYVANYLRYDLRSAAPCYSASGAPDYCTPAAYAPLPDRLFRNRRDGTFADVSVSARIASEFGPALGVSTADFNGDGWIDVYVANDGKDNQLWLNRHDGTFENAALMSGVAVPAHGKAEASMGVDAGDFDQDGDEDLFVTELTGEGSNLFVNDGSGVFEDRSTRSSLGPASLPLTGFGTAWFDFDNDGLLDLLSVNGTVQVIEALRQARDPFPLHQRKALFRNAGDGRFEDVTARAGAAFRLSEVGRGAAFGDIDNDGDVDVLIGNNNGPARLLLNDAARGRHWLGLRLVGTAARSREGQGRDMLGARVAVVRRDRPVIWRRSRTDGSYASANDPRVLVGLGESVEPPDVRVIWPSGRIETWTGLPIDTYVTLREGEGT